MILLTGATGANGSEIAALLSARGVPFRAMVRDLGRAASLAQLPGAEVVEGDFDDRASLRRALEGVERAFLLTPSTDRAEEQQIAFVEEASASGVRHVVKFSQLAADPHSSVRFLRYHAVVEAAVARSGMAWTFLRPNLFMQGFLMFRDMIRDQGMIAIAAGDARISAVDVRDNAAAAVAALTVGGHEGKTYALTGPEALTHKTLAQHLSEAAGYAVRYVEVTEDQMHDALAQMHMPAWQLDGLMEDYAHYRRGEASMVTTGVLDATGQPPRGFATFARDHAALLRRQG